MSNIHCGKDLSADVKAALSMCAFTVTDGNLAALYPEFTAGAYVIPAGEKNKNVNVLNDILEAMQARGLKRGDTVAAFGGGVVGDITGFAAALYMRGIDWVSIPTSLLAMVDSGIGGKTAVDFNGIKNLVGAFHSPRDIFINVGFLKTLPKREWLCGDGELIKTCLLTENAFKLLSDDLNAVFADDVDGIYPLITECVKIKNAVVTADPTEKNLRKILNLGHTVGHALESLDGYKLSHGEYVLKGLMTEAAMCKDMIDGGFYDGYIKLLKLFTTPPLSSSGAVCGKAVSDKKNNGDTISVVFPVRPAETKEVRLSADEFRARYDCAVKELKAE